MKLNQLYGFMNFGGSFPGGIIDILILIKLSNIRTRKNVFKFLFKSITDMTKFAFEWPLSQRMFI